MSDLIREHLAEAMGLLESCDLTSVDDLGLVVTRLKAIIWSLDSIPSSRRDSLLNEWIALEEVYAVSVEPSLLQIAEVNRPVLAKATRELRRLLQEEVHNIRGVDS